MTSRQASDEATIPRKSTVFKDIYLAFALFGPGLAANLRRLQYLIGDRGRVHPPKTAQISYSREEVMQFVLLVAAVLVSIATAVASAEVLLSVVFHFMSKLR